MVRINVYFLFLCCNLVLLSSRVHSFSASPAFEGKKVVLVTGGNKGIGRAICERLLDKYPEVHVLLGSRDVGRGEKTVKEIISSNKDFDRRIDCIQIDTSSDDSVTSCANEVRNMLSRSSASLYGIVNNAGIIGKGFDDIINVNYFGVRRVNDAFVDSNLIERPGGRIVNIASASGPMFVAGCRIPDLKTKLSLPLTVSDFDIAELDKLANSYSSQIDYTNNAYGLSKALLNAYTVLHANANPDLIVNSCSPGFIKTDMGAPLGASNPPEMGAISPVELLMSPRFTDIPTGRYYGSDAVRSPLDRYRGPGDPPYEGP